MGTGKDEISKEDEALDSARQMFEDADAEVEENETFEAMNNMFEQAEKEAAKKTAQDEDDANLEAVANMFEQADEEAAAKEAADEAEKNAPTEDADADEKQAATNDNSPVPKPAADDDKKKKHKDPMMELVEELNSFVASVNGAITDFVKDKGKEAWDKLNDTEPMKTLNGAMSELSQFAKDKVGEQVDKIADSKEVNDAKDFVKGLQDTVNSAFSQLMNMAANSIANAVKGITSPTPNAQDDVQAQAPEDTADDTFANDGIDELDEANAEPELANEDDAILEAVGKMFKDAEAEAEISAKMDTPADSLTSTSDEPMKALSDSMGDMDAQTNSKAPEPSPDMENDLSSGLSNAM
ncbi:hypothetical protein ACD661_13990 [Legionella lytica]|uniref:Coiled-coil protein n=1 Tax=Legionella lytica TaxID=96232 RepID=A0ABW8DCH8_9GAMM